MTRNSGSRRYTKPASLILLKHWQQLKALRSVLQLARDDISSVQGHVDISKASEQYIFIKRYIWNAYTEDALTMAHSFIRRKLPVKSLLAKEDAIQSMLRRMWRDMDVFDPDYMPVELWHDPKKNPFMQWFNSAERDGKSRSRLTGAIIDSMRELQNFPRAMSKKIRIYNQRMQELRQKLGKTPTNEEYLDEYGWAENFTGLRNPLLFSQVFNQSNAKPGESIEEELRFDGDCRRQEQSSLVSLKQAEANVKERVIRERKILDLIPDVNWQFAILAYYYWDWSLTHIAEDRNVSVTLASKWRLKGKEHLGNVLSEEEFKEFINEHPHK